MLVTSFTVLLYKKYVEDNLNDAETAAGANNMKELYQIFGYVSNQNTNRSRKIWKRKPTNKYNGTLP